MSALRDKLAQRPTEAITGPAAAMFLYGFLTEAHVDAPVAAIIAVAVAFVPLAISETIDRIRG